MSEMRLDPKIVGEVIAKYRMKKGLTQEVLSGLSRHWADPSERH